MGEITVIRMVILSISFIGVLVTSFIIVYLLGRIKGVQNYIQKVRDVETYFLKRGYCIFCCQFDVCPKGEDNTCRGCNLFEKEIGMKEHLIEDSYKFMTNFGLKDGHFYTLGKFTGQVIDRRNLYIEKRKIYFFKFTKEGIGYNKDDNSIYINNAYTMDNKSHYIENSKVSINNSLYTQGKWKNIKNYWFEEISEEDFLNLKNGKPRTRKVFSIG